MISGDSRFFHCWQVHGFVTYNIWHVYHQDSKVRIQKSFEIFSKVPQVSIQTFCIHFIEYSVAIIVIKQ